MVLAGRPGCFAGGPGVSDGENNDPPEPQPARFVSAEDQAAQAAGETCLEVLARAQQWAVDAGAVGCYVLLVKRDGGHATFVTEIARQDLVKLLAIDFVATAVQCSLEGKPVPPPPEPGERS